MDSQVDTSKQARQQTKLCEPTGDTLFQNDFCWGYYYMYNNNLLCFGEAWHDWGCCPNTVTSNYQHQVYRLSRTWTSVGVVWRSAQAQSLLHRLVLQQNTTQDLQYSLIRFIHDKWKKNDLEYLLHTLLPIVSGIMYHICQLWMTRDWFFLFLWKSTISWFLKTSRQKHLLWGGRAVLWDKKILKDHSPKALLNKSCSLVDCFALCSEAEHQQLRQSP